MFDVYYLNTTESLRQTINEEKRCYEYFMTINSWEFISLYHSSYIRINFQYISWSHQCRVWFFSFTRCRSIEQMKMLMNEWNLPKKVQGQQRRQVWYSVVGIVIVDGTGRLLQKMVQSRKSFATLYFKNRKSSSLRISYMYIKDSFILLFLHTFYF